MARKKMVQTPPGTAWCSLHEGGVGTYLPLSNFRIKTSGTPYAYCYDCTRDYQREWDRKHRSGLKSSLKQQTIAFYGGRCEQCGHFDWEVLDIYGPGSGAGRYRAALAASPGEYHLLCKNCWVKRG